MRDSNAGRQIIFSGKVLAILAPIIYIVVSFGGVAQLVRAWDS